MHVFFLLIQKLGNIFNYKKNKTGITFTKERCYKDVELRFELYCKKSLCKHDKIQYFVILLV